MKQIGNVFLVILFLITTSGYLYAGEKTTILKIDGMTCSLCVPAVKKALETTDGVKKADVIYKEAKAVVVYGAEETNPQALIKIIEKVGFKASEVEAKR